MTASTLTFHGRLPGVDCNPALPASGAAIRLDVAAFVGFAERGPLDLPIAVEDINQYHAVFGRDVVLAIDGGTPVYANLPGAVLAFFDNGGRRAYVIRVAGRQLDGDGDDVSAARASRWCVPGLRLWQTDGVVMDVYLDAAWPGRWSDDYGVGTQLLSQPLGVTAPYLRAMPAKPSVPATSGHLSLATGSMLLMQPGDLIRLDLGPAHPGLYVVVANVDRVHSVVTVAAEIAFLTGHESPPTPDEQLLLGPDALHDLPASLDVRAAWRLQMNLVAREVVAGDAQLLETWASLGFNPGSAGPSWLDVVQPADDNQPDQSRSMIMRADAQTVAAAGLPAAGCGYFLPVGMDQLGSSAEFIDAAPGADAESGVAAGLDGLDEFDPIAMFLDERLLGTTVYSLLPDAEALIASEGEASGPPRRRCRDAHLRGIHALIDVDEVALLSVPDAVHVGWSPTPARPTQPPPPQLPPSPPPLDWTDFRNCSVATPTTPPTDDHIDDNRPGPLYPLLDDPAGPLYPLLDDPAGYDASVLVALHTAVAQLCAARNDVFAVLAVPRHFDTAAVLAWLQALEDTSRDTQGGRTVMSPLSFAGFWHPWIRVVEQTSPSLAPLRDQPADGSVCGMIAARELARGVWLAPANVPLRGTVGLARALSSGDTARLFDQHANLLRTQPGAISCLSAHTLSTDRTLLQVSVRRLIILLRKIALREGNRYVFDTNTDRFRQLVRLRFERILSTLTRLGGLAAFQVVTDGGINTDDDIDNGRLIVILQIAPTSPIEFITVTLVRAGEGLLDVVVG